MKYSTEELIGFVADAIDPESELFAELEAHLLLSQKALEFLEMVRHDRSIMMPEHECLDEMFNLERGVR